MPRSSTRRRPHRKKTERGGLDFGAIQKWPAGGEAMLRNLYEMFASAEGSERKHPEIIEAHARSTKKPEGQSARKYTLRSPRTKTKTPK